MGFLEEYKPVMAMFALQSAYAGVTLYTGASFSQGLSPRVFVVYRLLIATLIFAPTAYFSKRREETKSSSEMKSFLLIFIASLIGVTIQQNSFFEGLYLASPSVGGAMMNTVPAITFLMAAIVGWEKVDIKSLRSMAKIAGTVICVCGAVSMAFLKGPKLLNIELMPENSVLHSGGDNWVVGCLLLFGCCCCWSIWLMMQVPISAIYPDHLSLSAWMCFFALLQSATLAFFLEPNPRSWMLHSSFEILCCVYTGIVSGVSFFIQSWCILQRGPLFSAMFTPLSTVIVTILACILLHEELHVGSLAGSVAVVIGLYLVLWGKAKDTEQRKSDLDSIPTNNAAKTVNLLVDDSLEKNSKMDLGKPLLAEKSGDVSGSKMNH